MIGPYQLSNIIYVVIVLVFVAAITYTIVHNQRLRKRQHQLFKPGETAENSPSSIVAATESLRHDNHRAA